MKLNDVQKFKLRQALDNTASVLREIKQKSLKKHELTDMKFMEDTVQRLEIIVLL